MEINMDYQIKIDMDNKSLIELLTHIIVDKLGLVSLSQVYSDDDGYKLAVSQAEKLEEIGFKTKITTINQ
tara:strand:+ start:655 stop:864 length:210 start_codon:yes stop_codon:yes gene_type:complete